MVDLGASTMMTIRLLKEGGPLASIEDVSRDLINLWTITVSPPLRNSLLIGASRSVGLVEIGCTTCPEQERVQIRETLVKIDFQNGDIHQFFIALSDPTSLGYILYTETGCTTPSPNPPSTLHFAGFFADFDLSISTFVRLLSGVGLRILVNCSV